jgi:hypothetical protein
MLPSMPRSHNPFMQNKPNFQNTKINLTSYGNMGYVNLHLHSQRQNKPNFQSKRTSPRAKPRGLLINTADNVGLSHLYNIGKMQNKPNFQNTKINLTSYGNMVYVNLHLHGQRQNKPNFKFVTGTLGNSQTLSAKGRILIFDFLLLTSNFFKANPICELVGKQEIEDTSSISCNICRDLVFFRQCAGSFCSV